MITRQPPPHRDLSSIFTMTIESRPCIAKATAPSARWLWGLAHRVFLGVAPTAKRSQAGRTVFTGRSFRRLCPANG